MAVHLTPAPVTARLELRLVVPAAPSVPLAAQLRFEPADPWAVALEFAYASGEPVTWVFARQLLTDGVTRPVGEGDVKVWPSQVAGQPIACICLRGGDGTTALLETPAAPLLDFLASSYVAVPHGSESRVTDIDAEIRHLLADDAG